MRLINFFAGGLLTLLTSPVSPAANAADAARDYPNRPVRIITGSPGSTSDIVPRFLASKLAGIWGQQIVVDNRPSAGGVIASELLLNAPADSVTKSPPVMPQWLTTGRRSASGSSAISFISVAPSGSLATSNSTCAPASCAMTSGSGCQWPQASSARHPSSSTKQRH